ncbi:hypothetical protein NLX67_00600 [Domibacillus sp. A3M-37]|uniref:hypothetical protein n=1 Tax=Domibacillus sp. A3M-37 TaxID=2962037 RepID=UPI0020B736DB|nr:hypothetical protein [Domibacillus sp. A3M-37]MCP3760894.1 hypothetical protein [Domibacillus sp. A3M-37]
MEKKTVVGVKYGDVTGDRVPDIVYLTAVQTPNSPFLQQITLVVQCRRTAQSFRIPLRENAGYHPTVFLGDMTGNKVKDILVVISAGGSGGTIYAYVFSFLNGRFAQIFDVNTFNEKGQYDVQYQNNYKAQVTSKEPDKRYILDLTTKGKEYLTEIYNSDGTLKKPIQGWLSPLSGLYPIDFERDGVYELDAYQGIAGRYNADRLGYMENVLKWNGRTFESGRQYVTIFGEER